MKILLIDNHPVSRLGYISLLEQSIPELDVREADSAEQALDLLAEFIPALVILEIALPGISGLECCRRILQRYPQMQLLVFSAHEEAAMARQALNSGARGYVSKSSPPSILIQAVQRMLAGHMYIEQELATRLAYQQNHEDDTDPRLESLSARELEVFVLQARGMPAVQIAEHLCISSKTVANYSTQVKHKLQVENRAELVHLAMDLGLIRNAGATS